MYARLLAGRSFEVVIISDARSMCEGYARAFAQVRGDPIIFAHHDIEYMFDDFAEVFDRAMSQFDVIGVAGTDQLVNPIWTHAGVGHLFGQITHPHPPGGYQVHVYGAHRPAIGGIQAMDGLFLAARRAVVERIGWDADTFTGFHFYDVDFTLRAAGAGYRLGVVSELGFLHHSAGQASEEYPMFVQRFAAKHRNAFVVREPRPFQVAIQIAQTLEEARAVMRPAHWAR
jgi:GT2 family glycosyltransferase